MGKNCRRFIGICCLVTVLVSTGSVAAQQAVQSAPSGRAPILAKPVESASMLLSEPGVSALAASPVDVVSLAPVDRIAIDKQDMLGEIAAGTPRRVGVNMQPPNGPISVDRDGSWFQIGNSDVWAISFVIPGALGARLHFSQFDLPTGTKIVIHGEGANALIVYEGKGPLSTGEFWSDAIAGQRITIEYQTPDTIIQLPKFQIDELSHIYRDSGVIDATPDSVLAAQLLLPCQEDVSCHVVDPIARDSVGRMLFTISGQGSFVCTGSLLSDSDPNTFAGYFLTANHCISTQTVTNTLQVKWFNQSSVCNGSVSAGFTTSGGTLLTTSANTDFTLIRLRDDPRNGEGFAAWTTVVPSGTVRGIHHPGGSFKRFSEGFTTTVPPICGGLPLSRYVYNDWTVGITEGGSSGSPLFNTSWEVVGQLFGTCQFATPGCSNPQDYNNVYGRFSESFSSMSTFLTSITPDDLFEDNDILADAKALGFGVHSLRLVDFDDFFRFTVCAVDELVATASFNESDMNLDLRLLDSSGVLLDISTGPGASETVMSTLQPGDYFIQLSKPNGWGGDYFLDVSLTNGVGACSAMATQPASSLPPENSVKSKYISFQPLNPGTPVSIRVVEPTSNTTKWVGWCPDLSTADADLAGCKSGFAAEEIAVLIDQMPAPRLWDDVTELHVTGCIVQPTFSYQVSATIDGVNFSTGLTSFTTTQWGDADANGNLNVLDILSTINRVALVPGSLLTLTQADNDADVPDGALNVLDILITINAVATFGEFTLTPLIDCP